MKLGRGALLVSLLVVSACGGGSRAAIPVPPTATSTSRRADPIAATLRPHDATDAARMLLAFLDATYSQRAAGAWYRGGGQQGLDGTTVEFEVLVQASTPAQALDRCPEIASAAAYFFGNFKYTLSLLGRIDVPIAGGVTYKDATFAPVACNAGPTVTDPVRATTPKDPTAATARLASFLDDYLRQYEWFMGAVRGLDPQGAGRVTVSTTDDRAATAGRCATLRPFVTWFVGPLHVSMVVATESGVRVTC